MICSFVCIVQLLGIATQSGFLSALHSSSLSIPACWWFLVWVLREGCSVYAFYSAGFPMFLLYILHCVVPQLTILLFSWALWSLVSNTESMKQPVTSQLLQVNFFLHILYLLLSFQIDLLFHNLFLCSVLENSHSYFWTLSISNVLF